ncbi:MAG: hypothetical protein HFF06_02745 [Oscillospiraceae bacterium]|nr:hypothetical protein [Oscillospiraceae bacterium]
MIDFLARALEQRGEEERGSRVEVKIPSPGAVFSPDRGEAVRAVFQQGEERGTGRNMGADSLARKVGGGLGEAPAGTGTAEEGVFGQMAAGLRAGGERRWEKRGRTERGGAERGEVLEGDRGRGELSLLSAVRRGERAASLARRPGRDLTATASEAAGGEAAGLTVEGLDRAVERDARRYDGGFSMY